MSVLIKGLDLPKHSGKCGIPELYSIRIKVYPDGQVEAYEKGSYEKHDVVEVPTPHGDLIDKKRIMLELCGSNMTEINRVFCKRVLETNSLTPVIIEAEK